MFLCGNKLHNSLISLRISWLRKKITFVVICIDSAHNTSMIMIVIDENSGSVGEGLADCRIIFVLKRICGFARNGVH